MSSVRSALVATENTSRAMSCYITSKTLWPCTFCVFLLWSVPWVNNTDTGFMPSELRRLVWCKVEIKRGQKHIRSLNFCCCDQDMA